MNLHHAQFLAITLVAKHLTSIPEHREWHFAWNNNITTLGTCYYQKKTIYLSKRWCRELPEEEVRDTILHEIAHAIAGYKAAHGPVWKAAAVLIGAKPRATATGTGVSKRALAYPTHQMVTHDGVVLKDYYRKPSAKVYRTIHTYYQKSRKAETHGRVRIVEINLLGML